MSLEMRRYLHIRNAKTSKYKDKRKVFQAINAVPEDDVKIEAIEKFQTITKEDLLNRENAIIRQHLENPLCVNTSRPVGLTPAEWRAANRQKIRDTQNTKFTCGCSGKYTRANKANHMRCAKHLAWLRRQTTPEPQQPIS